MTRYGKTNAALTACGTSGQGQNRRPPPGTAASQLGREPYELSPRCPPDQSTQVPTASTTSHQGR
jgi:hypothetical protein